MSLFYDIGEKVDPSTMLLDIRVDPKLFRRPNLVDKIDSCYLVGIQGLIQY